MANECNTSDSPEAQAQRANERADELKREQRLLDRLDEIKSVSEAHAVISDEYFNDMLAHMENTLEQDRLQDDDDGTHQAKALMGLDRIGDFASDHYHSLLCIDKNLNSISSSLKTFLSNTAKSHTKMESVNKTISEKREILNKSLHTNRNDLMMGLWSAQTSQLTSIHSVLVGHAESNQHLLKGFVSNMKKTLPEKSEITQDRREQQKRDLVVQNEREKDRSILLGIHRLLENMKFGKSDGKPVRGGIGIGGVASGVAIGTMISTLLDKLWGFVKKQGLKAWGLLIAGGTFLKEGAFKFFKGIGPFFEKVGAKLKSVFLRLGGFLKHMIGGLKGFLLRLTPFLAGMGAGLLTAIKGIATKGLFVLSKALPIAAAALGGWMLGSWLDKKFGISDKISDWLSGPNPSEIAANRIEDQSRMKQNRAKVAQQRLEKQAAISTGLDAKTIKSLVGGANLALFEKLTSAQQELIIQAQRERVKATVEWMKRTRVQSDTLLKDAGLIHSRAERDAIGKADAQNLVFTRSVGRQSVKLRKFKQIQQKKKVEENRKQEQQSIQINIQAREKQKILIQRQDAVKSATILLNENVNRDKQEIERMMTLEERRKKQLTEVRNDGMSDNLSKIAHFTEEALKRKNTYIVNSPSAPSITTPVGSMQK